MFGVAAEYRWRALLVAAALLHGGAVARAPQPWPPKPLPGYNIFNDQQEVWLGEVLAEELGLDQTVGDDPEAMAYLQSLGERLAATSKRPQLRYRFFLYDSDDLRAFALLGGRVYVSRGMIAFCQNEAELASVLGHEIAYIALRQGPKTFSRWLFWGLGVTKVTDKEDIRAKDQQLHRHFEDTQNRQVALDLLFGIMRMDEIWADKYGIWNAHAAGYDPEAALKVFGRFPPTEAEREENLFLVLVSTHPPTKDRLNLLKMEAFWMKKNKDAIVDTEAFRGVKARLVPRPPEPAVVPSPD